MSIKRKKVIHFLLIVLLSICVAAIVNPKPTGIAWVDRISSSLKLNMGLDLQGGVHLVYEADMSSIEPGGETDALSGIQDVIERRVNAFGVAEPKITPSKIGGNYRLIVELAGIKDVEDAKDLIKETPLLEFKEQGEPRTELTEEEEQFINEQEASLVKYNLEVEKKAEEVLQRLFQGEDFAELANEFSQDPGNAEGKGGDLGFFKKGMMVPEFDEVAFSEELKVGQIHKDLVKTQFGFHIIKKTDERGEGEEKEIRASHILFETSDFEQMKEMFKAQLLQPQFEPTGLTGKELEKAQANVDQQTGQQVVLLQFNNEGKKLFKEITERNLQKPVAIFLDGKRISSPVVQDVIRNGEAVISGNFTMANKEAQKLAQKLNAGALPVPITLISQQSVGASLGQDSLDKSLKAGLYGLIAVAIFMILYYRLAGVVAVVALVIYTGLMVAIFKLSSISQATTMTLTLSGIAGFVLSIGMAVDANILIFERMKEELRKKRDLRSSFKEGIKRAWPSIRDGNVSTIITSIILIAFGTGFVKGFALTLIIGVAFSMFTAIVVTRILFQLVLIRWLDKHKWLAMIGSPSGKSREKENFNKDKNQKND